MQGPLRDDSVHFALRFPVRVHGWLGDDEEEKCEEEKEKEKKE
jgi:hypothetical protein